MQRLVNLVKLIDQILLPISIETGSNTRKNLRKLMNSKTLLHTPFEMQALHEACVISGIPATLSSDLIFHLPRQEASFHSRREQLSNDCVLPHEPGPVR